MIPTLLFISDISTWHSCLCALKSRASGADLVGTSFSKGTHGELEGTPGHVLTLVLDTDRVHAHLGGDEADAIGVVLAFHDFSLVDLSGRTGDLGSHVGYADLCVPRKWELRRKYLSYSAIRSGNCFLQIEGTEWSKQDCLLKRCWEPFEYIHEYDFRGLPGILRLRSHWLPTLATEAALLFLVMLSFILPSPVTFTVKALPVSQKKAVERGY